MLMTFFTTKRNDWSFEPFYNRDASRNVYIACAWTGFMHPLAFLDLPLHGYIGEGMDI